MYWNFTTSREKGPQNFVRGLLQCRCRSKGNWMPWTRYSFWHSGKSQLAAQVSFEISFHHVGRGHRQKLPPGTQNPQYLHHPP